MDFDLKKFGIALVGIAIFFLAATRLTPFLLGSAARMMGAGRGSAGKAPEAETERWPAPPAAPAEAAPDATGFAREAVAAVAGDWDEIARINDLLARLAAGRQRVVAREGDLLPSQVAWKVAACAQAARHRVVAIATGATRLWNLRSVEGAILCARAVVEAAAVLLDTEQSLGRLCESGDLAGIDALATRLGFEDALGAGGAPVQPAAALMPLIEACDRQAPGTKARYDILAWLADPRAPGQVRRTGDLDKTGTMVSFPDTALFERGLLNQVAGGLQALAVAEGALAGIAAKLPRVIELDRG